VCCLVSPATRFDASDRKATYRPSPLIAETKELPCGLGAVTGDRLPRRDGGLTVVDKHIHRDVGVVGDEVRRAE